MHIMRNYKWETVSSIFEEKFGIPKNVLDLIAIKDILNLCVSGSSNSKIARFLELEDEYVEVVLQEFLDFPGWEMDLDFNPYMIYRNFISSGQESFALFYKEIVTITPYYSLEEINKIFSLCQKFYNIETEIERYWI